MWSKDASLKPIATLLAMFTGSSILKKNRDLKKENAEESKCCLTCFPINTHVLQAGLPQPLTNTLSASEITPPKVKGVEPIILRWLLGVAMLAKLCQNLFSKCQRFNGYYFVRTTM